MIISDIIEGNKKYARTVDHKLLKELVENGQKPVAIIISCSDSRVPVEVIFNQLNPGSLFVIRIAGNIISDSSVKGSIEYAVQHLKTPYLIIIGHTECGAVKARLDGITEGEVGKLVNNINIRSRELDKAIRENIDLQVKRASEIPCVKIALDQKAIEIYGILYDLTTGTANVINKNGKPYSG